jgi:hypothetical protein
MFIHCFPSQLPPPDIGRGQLKVRRFAHSRCVSVAVAAHDFRLVCLDHLSRTVVADVEVDPFKAFRRRNSDFGLRSVRVESEALAAGSIWGRFFVTLKLDCFKLWRLPYKVGSRFCR